MRPAGVVAALGLVLAGWPLAAVGQTAITPDVGAARGLGTNVIRAGPVYTIAGGTRAGGNLFHSFAQFDLGAGDIARWVRPGDAGAIANVINRVTGGTASHISGLIDSTALPNATFYFVNPAGIVFGPGAQLNVPSAAHFSTAGELRFANGDRFTIAAPNGSTLSVGPPDAWGFLGAQGAITVENVTPDFATERMTLHFTASDISINGSEIVTRGLDLIGVGEGTAAVRLADPLSGANRGLVQVGGSLLSAVETSVGGRSFRVGGGVVDIEASSLTSNGNLFVTATERLETSGAAFGVSSITRAAAGAIELRAPEIVLDVTNVRADAQGDGAPGRILIEGDRLGLFGARVEAGALDAEGALPGLIQLFATGNLLLSNTFIQSNTEGVAKGGIVTLAGRNILLDGSNVSSDSLGFGDAGRVGVKADTLRLTAGSKVTSTTRFEGRGGDVGLDVGALTMDFDAAIRSDTLGSGSAGQVFINATTMDLMDGASITSRAQSGTGHAGAVMITVGRLSLTDANISSGTDGFGHGGRVEVTANDIILDGSRREFTGITSDARGPGAAGDVVIVTKTMTVRDSAVVSSNTRTDGDAGTVTVKADAVTVSNKGKISSDSFGLGDAGDVTVTARKLTVLGGDGAGLISSDSFVGGDAGKVIVNVGTVLVDGGFISSDTSGTGDAGDVIINAEAITLQNFGLISSQTMSNGDAGSVSIVTGSLTILEGSGVSTAATLPSTGNAGDIDITADTINIKGAMGGILSGTRGPGDAGELKIVTKTLVVDRGVVSSAADLGSTGASGSLDITAQSVSVVNGGAISTRSVNPKRAGEIAILTGTLRVDGLGSIISSENQAGSGMPGRPGGDAGSISITADNITISNGARVSTNSFSEAAGDITISIARPGLLVLEGAEAPGIIQTSSGRGTGGMITLVDPFAIISNGGAILALGQQRGANVQISSRYFINSSDRTNVVDVDGEFELQTGLYDVSSGTVSRDLSVLDASKVLQGQCPVARSTGVVSQLITRPVGPYVRDAGFGAPQPRAGTANLGACP